MSFLLFVEGECRAYIGLMIPGLEIEERNRKIWGLVIEKTQLVHTGASIISVGFWCGF